MFQHLSEPDIALRLLEEWGVKVEKRLTDEHIAPVEALRSDRDGTWTMRLVLEDGELEKLQRGAAVFLFIQATHLVPFAVEVIE